MTGPPEPLKRRRGLSPGLLTWSEIWCDVDNSKRFRSSRDGRVSPGHRLEGGSALHNSLASIFTAPGVTTWIDTSGNTRKNQVTRLVTLRHRSTMSGVLGSYAIRDAGPLIRQLLPTIQRLRGGPWMRTSTISRGFWSNKLPSFADSRRKVISSRFASYNARSR